MPSYKNINLKYTSGNLDLTSKFEHLKSLAGCPDHITGNFKCIQLRLTSLTGGPEKVDGYYFCSNNQLTNLEGCAKHIDGELYFGNNKITSLIGIHKIIKSCRRIFFDCEHIIEGGIGLLLIDNLTEITDKTSPFDIISKYLGTGSKGILQCQNELIENGYPNHAKL